MYDRFEFEHDLLQFQENHIIFVNCMKKKLFSDF